MNKILSKTKLAEKIVKMEIYAPDIAKNAKAGQFVILRVIEQGERIPLTVAEANPKNSSITIIVQEIGKTTALLSSLKEGDQILDLVGPLGHPTESVKYGTVVAIGGGVGAAEILPVAKMYRQCGNKVVGIIGARNKEMVILEKEMAEVCDELIVTTDDGSYLRKGFVTEVLAELINKGNKIELVYAIGPVPMMRAVSNLTKPHKIKTIVSLNPIMVDGTGMCGACRVTVAGETKFACVHGPEFDGHDVAWDELVMRLAGFKHKENISTEKYRRGCSCKQEK